MSDIGILNSPLAIAFLLALLGGPGLGVGAVIGALLWRRHRVIGWPHRSDFRFRHIGCSYRLVTATTPPDVYAFVNVDP